jgi:hypothetical protein
MAENLPAGWNFEVAAAQVQRSIIAIPARFGKTGKTHSRQGGMP